MDDEFAKRINEKSLENDEVVEIFRIILEHNTQCPHGYEIIFEMFISESSVFADENLTYLQKD